MFSGIVTRDCILRRSLFILLEMTFTFCENRLSLSETKKTGMMQICKVRGLIRRVLSLGSPIV